jgi:type I restriction enzyme, S subunit
MNICRIKRKPVTPKWSELPRWDYKSARAALFAQRHPDFVPLGEYTDEATELVDPRSEPDKEWPVYGVNNESGVFLSKLQKGAEFNSNYKRVRQDYFFHNPTRANVGSLGRVPDVPADAITSPEYQVWKPRPILLPAFTEILIKTSFFLDQIECHRVGGVKERLFVQNLFEIPVPVPDLPVQQKIVAHWEAAQREASVAIEAVKEIEKTLELGLLRKAGVEMPSVVPRKGRFSISFKQNERWDTFFFRKDFVSLESRISSQRHINLGAALNFTSRAWKTQDFIDGEFNYIEISSVNKINGITSTKKIKLDEAPSRATTKVKEGDIIISTTRPYLGSFAIIDKHHDGFVCSSGFALADSVKSKDLTKEFILFFLKSPAGLRQVERRMSGGLYPAIVQSELEKVLLPVPALSVQQEIVEEYKNGIGEIRRLLKGAKNCEEDALQRIEKTLLGIGHIEAL